METVKQEETGFQTYDQENYQKIKRNVNARMKFLQNSDQYINAQRQVLIDSLNNRTRKWISEKTRAKLNIRQYFRSLQYYLKYLFTNMIIDIFRIINNHIVIFVD